MRRGAYPLASTAFCAVCVAACVAACNALTGVSDLSPCALCDLDGATPLIDAAGDTAVGKPDGGTTPDARDGASGPDAAPADAGADGPIDTGVDAPAIGCQGAVACTRVVFVSSLDYTGNLGGVAGADAKCQALADQSTNARIKGHTFQAWVSTSMSPVSGRFTHGSQPYVLGDATVVAADWNELTKGSLSNGIDLDELGNTRMNSVAWTGTTSNGANYAGQGCGDWTVGVAGTKGVYGNVGGTGSGWSSSSINDCSNSNALYCFEK